MIPDLQVQARITAIELSKLRQAELRATADADRLADLLPRHARPVRSMHLPNFAAAYCVAPPARIWQAKNPMSYRGAGRGSTTDY